MIAIRPMTIADYDAVLNLMKQTPGVSVRDADARDSTQRYLARNPGLSLVACDGDSIVGCIMSGHDGRRGYLQHLVVHSGHRRQGVGSELVARCVDALAEAGIDKCHLDVLKTNHAAAAYWARRGWTLRTDIDRYSRVASGNRNA